MFTRNRICLTFLVIAPGLKYDSVYMNKKIFLFSNFLGVLCVSSAVLAGSQGPKCIKGQIKKKSDLSTPPFPQGSYREACYVSSRGEEIINGENFTFFKSGKIRSKSTKVNGLTQGLVTTFYEKGSVESESFIKDDKANGTFKDYFENGHVAKEGTNYQGKYSGKIKSYSEDGSVKSIDLYNDKTHLARFEEDLRDFQLHNCTDSYLKFSPKAKASLTKKKSSPQDPDWIKFCEEFKGLKFSDLETAQKQNGFILGVAKTASPLEVKFVYETVDNKLVLNMATIIDFPEDTQVDIEEKSGLGFMKMGIDCPNKTCAKK